MLQSARRVPPPLVQQFARQPPPAQSAVRAWACPPLPLGVGRVDEAQHAVAKGGLAEGAEVRLLVPAVAAEVLLDCEAAAGRVGLEGREVGFLCPPLIALQHRVGGGGGLDGGRGDGPRVRGQSKVWGRRFGGGIRAAALGVSCEQKVEVGTLWGGMRLHPPRCNPSRPSTCHRSFSATWPPRHMPPQAPRPPLTAARAAWG